MDSPDPTIIAALEREREGYERAGKADRIKAVDEAIKAAGGKPPTKKGRGRGKAVDPDLEES